MTVAHYIQIFWCFLNMCALSFIQGTTFLGHDSSCLVQLWTCSATINIDEVSGVIFQQRFPRHMLHISRSVSATS